MSQIKMKIAQLGITIKNSIPYYKFQRKIILTELLGDICIVRSELNANIYEYSNILTRLENDYLAFLQSKKDDKSDIIRLIISKKQAQNLKNKLNNLVNKNESLTSKVIDLKNIDHINNPDIEKGISKSIKKVERLNNEFEILSRKVSKLNNRQSKSILAFASLFLILIFIN